MPPKKQTKPIEPTDRITRASHTATQPRVPQEERPASPASDVSTVVPDSSPGTSVWSIQDSISEQEFFDNIDITSTGELPRLQNLPPAVNRSYSPTEFDNQNLTTNQTVFQSVIMSSHGDDEEHDRMLQEEEDQRQRRARENIPPPMPPIKIPGMSPDVMAMIQMMQAQQQQAFAAQAAAQKEQNERFQMLFLTERKDREAAERRQERARKEEREQNDANIKHMVDQIAGLTATKPERARPPTARLPSFDIDKDQKSFPQWKGRWEAYIKANKLHTISDPEEKKDRLMGDLTSALTDNTLRWILHRDMPEEDRSDAEKVIQAIEDHIKESTNPVVAVVELITMKRYPNETADHLNARINEKLTQCDTSSITDVRDYLGLIATIVACEPHLRKRMYLDKINTHAKAALAVKADEQATVHSKMLPADTPASVNATSTYKRDQTRDRQAQQPQQERPREDQGSHRGQARGRGRYERLEWGHNRDQSRGRSESRDQPQRQSRPESQSGSQKPCYRCGKTNHIPSECWFIDKECLNCHKIGHIAPACRGPKQSQAANGSSNSVEGSLGAVMATTGVQSLKQKFEQMSRQNQSNATAETLRAGSRTQASSRRPPTQSLVNPVVGSVEKDLEIPDLEPLDTIQIRVQFAVENAQPFNMEILPDTGANVTAIDQADAKGMPLESTSMVLRVADGKTLNTLGSIEAIISRHGIEAAEQIYVVQGLTRPLLSRRMLKAIGMIHPEFPHQDLRQARKEFGAAANTVMPEGPASIATSNATLRAPTPAPRAAYCIYKQDLPTPEEKARNVVFVDVGYIGVQAAPHQDLRQARKEFGAVANTVMPGGPASIATLNATLRAPTPAPRATSRSTSLSTTPKPPSNSPLKPQEWLESDHGPEFDTLYSEFGDIFSGNCKPMNSEPYRMELTEDAVPVKFKVRFKRIASQNQIGKKASPPHANTYKSKKPADLTWPNNQPVTPRKRGPNTPTSTATPAGSNPPDWRQFQPKSPESSTDPAYKSFNSAADRKKRMEMAPTHTPTTPTWDTNSTWRTPPTQMGTIPHTSTERPKRTDAKQVDYREARKYNQQIRN